MDALQELLASRIAGFDGRAAVVAAFLTNKNEVSARVAVNEDEVFPAASLVKLPILIVALRAAESGALNLLERVTLTRDDQAGGSGVLGDLLPGATLTVHDLLRLMIVVSDNTATNMVLARLGGPDVVNNFLSQRSLSVTRVLGPLQAPPERRSAAQRAGGRAQTTAAEMNSILLGLQRGDYLSLSSRNLALNFLAAQQVNDVIPRYLAPAFTVAHKTGELPGIRHDAGLVSTGFGVVGLSLLSQTAQMPSSGVEAPGALLLAVLAREVMAASDLLGT